MKSCSLSDADEANRQVIAQLLETPQIEVAVAPQTVGGVTSPSCNHGVVTSGDGKDGTMLQDGDGVISLSCGDDTVVSDHGTEGTTLTPSMSAIVIGMRLACAFNRLALVDSGATNNMRPGTTSEAEQAVAVTVQLADGVGSLLQTPTGTLLCGSETQTILSLGQCVDVLKCKSMWTPEKGFTLTHPKHGCIYAKTDEGTPLIPEAVALRAGAAFATNLFSRS